MTKRFAARHVAAAALGIGLIAPWMTGTLAQADPPDPGPAQVLQDALNEAASSGEPVVVDELTNETEEVLANPDRTFTLTSHTMPVRVEEDGEWLPVDTSLTEGDGGRIEPARTSVDMSFSSGGDDVLATSETEDGKVILRSPFVLPEPLIDQDVLTYPEVLPGVDLVVQVGAESYSEVLVVKDAEAAANPALATIDFTVSSPSLSFTHRPDGSTEAVDADGDAVFVSPAPLMWDAAPVRGVGPEASALIAGEALTEVDIEADRVTKHETVLTLTPPEESLTGDDVVFPVYIDPSIGPSRLNFAVVRSTGSTYYNTSGQDLRVGYCAWAGCSPYYKARSYFNFSIKALNDSSGKSAIIHSAKVTAVQVHNGSGAATDVELHKSGSLTKDTEWPGPIGSLLDTKAKSGTGSVQFSSSKIADYIQDYSDYSSVWFGLKSPEESDPYHWKRFDNDPSLTVKYSFPVGVPTALGISNNLKCGSTLYARDKRPTFSATGTEYNPNEPIPLKIEFQILKATSDTQVGAIGSDTSTHGVAATWKPSTDLADGNYRFRARTVSNPSDNTGATSAWSSAVAFTIDTQAPTAATIGSFTHPRGYTAGSGAPVTVVGDRQSGKFTLSVSGDSRIAGFAYSFDTSVVPSLSGKNCSTATNESGTSGYIKASNGTATLNLPAAVTGEKTLTVKALDEAGNASAASTGYSFIRSATDTSYQEMETKGITEPGGGTWTVENQSYLSNGSQLLAQSPAVGKRYSVTFNVPSTGQWSLEPLMVKASNRGKVQFEVDGQTVPLVAPDPTIPWGGETVEPIVVNLHVSSGTLSAAEYLPVPLQLTAGAHTLTLISAGAGTGGGTTFSLDALRLIKQG
ncbi:hypothetical protein [Tessaracoccus caeni]|uniref:hypothetical protein n=1 Tax=Tessaracoccus caeni TaxID=3031239 RepID=UPI0023DCAD28|nr:hypothetical protein [Tessaracoccus caeni]MDF1488270.1 hypothetical protein [Tessaracoccus caeni]